MLNIVFLVAILNYASSSTTYSIPTPNIEAYKPRGLRITIPDAPGIELAAFHININEEIDDKEGDYSKYVVRPQNGLWVYEYNTVKLKKGDKIYLRLLIQKDGLRYVWESEPYAIPDIKTKPTPSDIPEATSTIAIDQLHYAASKNNAETTDVIDYMIQENDCPEQFKSMANKTIHLQDRLLDAEEEISILKSLVYAPFYVEISGLIVQANTPNDTVNLVLRNKLHLDDLEVNDIKKTGKIIKIELKDIEAKVKIMKSAKRHIVQSQRVRLTY